MKKNLPVTDNVFDYDDRTIISSSTDLKGSLTSINQEFMDISGYSADELMGKNHNIVRHPDMPPAAFQDLWGNLKLGKAWMGLVKNRCKNGDAYWVDAFVTPVKHKGQVTGYESTRVKPKAEQIKRAEGLYQKIWSGKKLKLKSMGLRNKLILGSVAVLLAMFAGFTLTGLLDATVATAGWVISSALVALVTAYQLRALQAVIKESREIVDNKVMQMAYIGNVDDVGNIQLAMSMLKAKLRTVVKRIDQTSEQLASQAGQSARTIVASNLSMNKQQQEIEMVATAINEMTVTVQEVANNTTNAATQAHDVAKLAQQGALKITDAIGIIDSLDTHVNAASASIEELKDHSDNIGGVLDVIRGIAEQTNLLALNAAIEAARAGEQGRGFAVVADEVRTLASRSHESTEEIHQMIEKLQSGVAAAVDNMSQMKERAAEGVAQVEESAEALAEIAGSVNIITDMTDQIATATEEQNAVANEVNQNIERINSFSVETSEHAEQSKRSSEMLADLSQQLHIMIEQFDEAN